MKKRITKILAMVLSLALLSSLAMVASPVLAQPGENEWAEIDLPPVAPGTDVELLATAADGTLFASVWDSNADPGEEWTIYRSEPDADGIAGWEWDATEFADYGVAITDIVPATNWGDNDTVYVATADGQVYRCTSAGDDTPILLRQIVDNLTTPAATVYDMDLWTDGNAVWIMVATDIDVLVMQDALFAEWIDMDLTISFDGVHASQDGTVHAPFVAAATCNFAPDFDQSGLIWSIVVTSGDNAWVSATISPGQWGQVVNSVQVTTGGGLDYPVDLDFSSFYTSASAPVLFAAIGTNGSGEGDIYLIEGGFDADNSVATPLLVDGGGIDFMSVQVSDQVIMAGERYNADVWISRNGGDTFNQASKPPTGETMTQVLMSVPGSFDPDTGIAYAATSGIESAFSYTVDGGDTWNQTNFVDTEILNIIDLAFDPITASQPAIMMTDDESPSSDSFWRSPDLTADNPKWERTNLSDISALDNFMAVEYAMDGSVIMLFGPSGADYVIQKSTDNGQTWSTWRTLPPAVGGIHDWVVLDSATIFAACDNGFYGTTRFGPAKQRLDGEVLMSIAYDPGSHLIAGNNNGEIFVSDDDGATWGTAQDVSAIAGGGDIYVAFDADFNVEGADGEGLIYFVGSDDDYDVGVAEIDDVDGSAEALLDDTNEDAITDVHDTDGFVGIHVSPGAMADGGNALYAICETGYTYRLLLHEEDSVWEVAQDDDLSVPRGLWGTTGSNILWTIDDDGAELWALEDTVAGMVTGVSVSGETISTATVDWNEMTGADEYQLAYDSSSVYSDEPPVTLSGLSDNTEYDAAVRVAEGHPFTSRWSSGTTFFTLEYLATPENEVPFNGMQEAPLLPSFVWGSVSAAEYYEFQLTTNPAYDEDGFVSGLVTGTPTNIDAPTTAYTQTDELAYDTNHYWIVRAVSTDSLSGEIAYSGWCFSNFHTRVEVIVLPPVILPDPVTPVIDITVSLPQPTVTVNVPDVIVDSPDIVVNVPPVVTVTQAPTPPQQTFVLPERDDPSTPVYIWVIVGIGAILTIAVIVLIIRTRRVV
ncbi:hypothetical protein ACFLYB_02315 [Chloroflexota bacterium]